MTSKIELWGWEKKPRTMLRHIKVGDIVCFEIDKTGTKFGYGQLISKLKTGGFVLKAMNIVHNNPNDITIYEVLNSDLFGKPCILDAYTAFDKKMTKNGEWRIIGREIEFIANKEDLDSIYFVYGINGYKKRINLLNEEEIISDMEADNYPDAGINTGDQVKMWYIKYNNSIFT